MLQNSRTLSTTTQLTLAALTHHSLTTHSPLTTTHLLIHSLTRPLTHSLTTHFHSLTHLLTHLLTHSLTHSRLTNRRFSGRQRHTLTHSLTHSLTHKKKEVFQSFSLSVFHSFIGHFAIYLLLAFSPLMVQSHPQSLAQPSHSFQIISNLPLAEEACENKQLFTDVSLYISVFPNRQVMCFIISF